MSREIQKSNEKGEVMGWGEAIAIEITSVNFGWRYSVVVVVFTVWLAALSSFPLITDHLFRWLSSEDNDDTVYQGLAFA